MKRYLLRGCKGCIRERVDYEGCLACDDTWAIFEEEGQGRKDAIADAQTLVDFLELTGWPPHLEPLVKRSLVGYAMAYGILVDSRDNYQHVDTIVSGARFAASSAFMAVDGLRG